MTCACFPKDQDISAPWYTRALNQRKALLHSSGFSLTGDILEVGCGNGALAKLIASKDKDAKVTGIDMSCSPGRCSCDARAWSIQHGNAMDMDFPTARFDKIYSFGCFEHIPDVGLALNEIYRVLKPGGKVYLQFWPIWTSVIGHHSQFFLADKVTDIPPWGHLYLAPNELTEVLAEKYPLGEAKERVHDVYFSPKINRIGFKEQLMNFSTSPFKSIAVEKIQWTCREHVFGKRANELSKLAPDVRRRLLREYGETALTTTGLMVRLIK